MGFDLNRHWQDPSPWAHPTLHAVKQLIVQMNQDPVSQYAHTIASAGPKYNFLPPCLVQHVLPIYVLCCVHWGTWG